MLRTLRDLIRCFWLLALVGAEQFRPSRPEFRLR